MSPTATPSHDLPAGGYSSDQAWNPTQIPRPGVNSSTAVLYNPSSGLCRGRIIYFPSTAALHTQISTNDPPNSDQNTFLQNCLLNSWQVIAVDEIGAYIPVCTALGVKDWVETDVSNDSGDGARFLATQMHYFDHAMTWAQRTSAGTGHAAAMPTIVAGFSWGAWASCQVAINRTSQIIGYIARSPATQFGGIPTGLPGEVTGNGPVVGALCPNYGSANFSGSDLQTMSKVSITHASQSGSTVTFTLSTSAPEILANQWVVVESVTGGTWGAIMGARQVQSNSGTTLVLEGITSTPTGTLTGGTVRNNTCLNGVGVPGFLMWGGVSSYEDGGLINPYDVEIMANNASLAGQNITSYYESGETHQWSTVDSNLMSVNTWASGTTYSTGDWVYYSGDVYQALQSTTGNVPTGGSPNWSAGTAWSSGEGWIPETFGSLPAIY